MSRQAASSPAAGGLDHGKLLAELSSTLDGVVREALAGRSEAVILDAPLHRNAGDLLILQGTMQTLRRLGVEVRWIQDWRATSWEGLKRLGSETAVVLSGGGNLGGLYPNNDAYRARVLRRVRSPEQVICMPQSVHFPTPESGDRVRSLYREFGGARFLIRDKVSLSRIRDAIPELAGSTFHSPDAAFGTSLRRSREPDVDVLLLQRRDGESRRLELGRRLDGLDLIDTDWPTLNSDYIQFRALRRFVSSVDDVRALVERAPLSDSRRAAGIRFLETMWQQPQRALLRAHSRVCVESLAHTLGRGRIVVTDRLHAHVGATLLGTPNIVVDNTDGKIGALVRDWTSSFSTTNYAADVGGLADHARAILADADARPA